MKDKSFSREKEATTKKRREEKMFFLKNCFVLPKTNYSSISSPRVPPSCCRPMDHSCRISNLVCSCSWQCKLLPQACWSSLAAVRRWSCWLLPLSLPGWDCTCCKLWSEPHSSVSGFSTFSTLNNAARTCETQILLWLQKCFYFWIKHLLLSVSFVLLHRNSYFLSYRYLLCECNQKQSV